MNAEIVSPIISTCNLKKLYVLGVPVDDVKCMFVLPKLPDNAEHKELQGVLTSSFSPIWSTYVGVDSDPTPDTMWKLWAQGSKHYLPAS